jgi:hypothetical protein
MGTKEGLLQMMVPYFVMLGAPFLHIDTSIWIRYREFDHLICHCWGDDEKGVSGIVIHQGRRGVICPWSNCLDVSDS